MKKSTMIYGLLLSVTTLTGCADGSNPRGPLSAATPAEAQPITSSAGPAKRAVPASVPTDAAHDTALRDGTNFLEAVRSGDVARVKLLLQANPGLAKPNDRFGGVNPLLEAAANGNTPIAKLLLANQAAVNGKDKNSGETPLHKAAEFGQQDMVKLLLGHGAEINAKDDDGNRPLHAALAHGFKDVAQVLRRHGGQEMTATEALAKPLGELVLSLFPMELTLEFNADTGARIPHRTHPANYDESAILIKIQQLLEAGVDPNAVAIAGYAADKWTDAFGHAKIFDRGDPGHVVPACKNSIPLAAYCKINGFATAEKLLRKHDQTLTLNPL